MKLFAGRLFAGRQFVGRLFGREQVRDETGIRGGFDVDQEPTLWWKRKPKALAPEEATQRLKRAAEVIVSKAKRHADDREPVAQRRAEVKQAIAPMLAQMPGFDWRPMYDAAYSWAVSTLIVSTPLFLSACSFNADALELGWRDDLRRSYGTTNL